MAECLGDRLARLAVGHHARELEVRMRGEQPQQLAGDIAGAAEHDRRNAAVASLRAAPRQRAAPCAAPRPDRLDDCVAERRGIAQRVEGATPICCSMISMPT